MKKLLVGLVCVLSWSVTGAEAGKNDAAIQQGMEQMRQMFNDGNRETVNAMIDGMQEGYEQGQRSNQCFRQCSDEMRGRLRPGQSRSCQNDRGCNICMSQCESNSR